MDAWHIGVLIAVGVVAAGAAARGFGAGRIISSLVLVAIASIAVVSAAVSALVTVNMRTYDTLEPSTTLAYITFTQVRPTLYDAQVERPGRDGADAPPPLELQAEGDMWRVDARLLRPKLAHATDGTATLYRIERLTSAFAAPDATFASPAAARRDTPSERLSSNVGLDVWTLSRGPARTVSPWDPIAPTPALEGPLADGAVFALAVDDRSEVFVRPENAQARAAFDTFNAMQP